MKYYAITNYYYSPRAQRISSFYGIKIGTSFSIKCLLKGNSTEMIIFLFCANVFLGGYLIRVWERLGSDVPNLTYDNYFNCAWYAFISMSTVGYGDYYAQSTWGRIFAFMVVVCGVFVNSILIVILLNHFSFQGNELKAYNMLNMIHMKNHINELTKKLFTKIFFINLFLKKRKYESNGKKLRMINDKIKKYQKEKEHLSRQIKTEKISMSNMIEKDFIDMIFDKLDGVMKSISHIKERIEGFDQLIKNKAENYRNLTAIKYSLMSKDLSQ
jgi:hypothetical protein